MIRLLITSGRGPVECRIAVANTLHAMGGEADAMGLDLDVAYAAQSDTHGPASAIVVIGGDGEAAFASRWLGSILWVAPSPVRAHCRRKNWFIGIVELPSRSHASDVVLAASDLRFETFRAGGPGGQHQNKTESAVRVVHIPTGIAALARDGRSQHRNKAQAVERLRAVLSLRGAMARDSEQVLVHAGHDRLERGQPVRRFVGPKFVEG